MKRIIFILLFSVLSTPINTAVAKDIFNLKVLHTNDLHAHLLPFNTDGENCSYESCLGGFARIKTFIERKRKEDSELLLLDAGDRFSGTIFYSLNKGKDIAFLMDKMNYDAMALGNHDFDDDLAELVKFKRSVKAPLIASNVQFPDDSELQSTVLQALTIQKKGRQIGILSILTPETKEACENADKITFLDEKKIIKKHIQKLKEKDINIIILLNHNGIEEDIKLAKEIPDIDLIISAHSHTLLSNKTKAKGPYPLVVKNALGQVSLIVSAGIGGQHIGEINLTFNKNGEITSFNGDTIPMDASIQADKEAADYIAVTEQRIKEIAHQPIRQLEQEIPLTGKEVFCSESCYMGEILTNALLQAAQTENKDVHISLLNAGAIRSAIPKGEITLKHIAQTYPFNSNAVIVELNGEDLKKYINHGLKKYQDNDRTNAFLQAGGLNYQFSPKTKQLISVNLKNGEALINDKTYLIAIPSFLGKGGDGFPKLDTKETISFGTIQDILIKYFKTEKKLPAFENRIKKTD